MDAHMEGLRLRQRILDTPRQAERRIGIDMELGAKKIEKKVEVHFW